MAAAWDAVVVGAGPNGLAAAVELARAGRSVLVLEANATAGGGARTLELTLPGFRHDHCSAVHPLARGSPYFRTLPLEEHGLEWIDSPVPLAHPLDDGTAVLLERSLDATAAGLGADGDAWRRLFAPLVHGWDALAADLLGPPRLPRHPVLLARFGLQATSSAESLLRRRFRGERARALFAGLAGHAIWPLTRRPTAAFGLVLGAAGHAVGWPIPRGGAQAIPDALVALLRSLGGEVRTGCRVRRLEDLPPARAVLLDLTPRQLLEIAGERLPRRYAARLRRFRYGPGAFKVDWALAGPVPWREKECARAATLHLGGSAEEIVASEERATTSGPVPERPFVLFSQPSLFDPTRAPAGRHTAWGYCHVPHGSDEPVLDRIEAQVERFAPGFRDLVLARSARGPRDLERDDANLVGGDIAGGAPSGLQSVFRPVVALDPYATPLRDVWICSASTPPGAGVHGMCGHFAARSALRRLG